MPYTFNTLRQDLLDLKYEKWDWAGAGTRGAFDIEELARYCWKAYDSAYSTSGDMVIGRVPHLQANGLYAKVGNIVGNATLFHTGTQGNLLKMDKWARVMNDSWVIGGVHREAKFRLASPRVLENLWNQSDGYQVVTARELSGLLHFGYELHKLPFQVLMVKDSTLAFAATIVEYEEHIRRTGTFRAAIDMIDKQSPQAQLMAEIRAQKKG